MKFKTINGWTKALLIAMTHVAEVGEKDMLNEEGMKALNDFNLNDDAEGYAKLRAWLEENVED